MLRPTAKLAPTTTCLASPHLPGELVESRIIHLNPAHMFIPLAIFTLVLRLWRDLVLEVLVISHDQLS
jgi:hypothetical protein